MRFSLFSTFLTCAMIFLSNACIAQKETVDVTVYDIIYLKDGRVLRGEIILFEEADGDVTFKDQQGRTYSFSREDYKYFEEDKQFTTRKDNFVLRERKEDGLEVSLGFSLSLISDRHDFEADDSYLAGNGDYPGYSDVPLSFRAGLGTYLNRQNYLGLTADILVASDVPSYFNVGLRYKYQYDSYKSNTAFYIPVEAQYSTLTTSEFYQVYDTTFFDGGYSEISDLEVEHEFDAVTLGLGQGVAFILNNQKSLALELLVAKSFILSEELVVPDGKPAPEGDSRVTTVKFSLIYNL